MIFDFIFKIYNEKHAFMSNGQIYVQRGRRHSNNDSQDIEPLLYIHPLLRPRFRRYLPQSMEIYTTSH